MSDKCGKLGEILTVAIKEKIIKAKDDIVEEEIGLLRDKIKRRVSEVVSKIVLQVFEQANYERFGTDIKITIILRDQDDGGKR